MFRVTFLKCSCLRDMTAVCASHRRRREKWTTIVLCFSFCLLIWGCGDSNPTAESLVEQLFGQADGVFRGLGVGSTAEEVKKQEGGNPRFEDQWGLQYEINLGESRELLIDYLLEDSSRRVKSIVALLSLRDEVEASEQFNAIETRLSRDYGVPDGSFGDYFWGPQRVNLSIQLRLLENKSSLSLNFFQSLAR